jgi:hypothetical protein
MKMAHSWFVNYRRIGLLFFLALCICSFSGFRTQKAPAWVGKGSHRILVRVDPMDLLGRNSDEMPTRIHITADDVLALTGSQRKIDAASFEVEQYDPNSGEPVPYGKWVYAHAAWELPYRWYDDSIPEQFPEVVGNVNPQTGELAFTPQRNWGYFYETLGEWNGGNLAWTHIQRGGRPSYYAIYFDLLPAGNEPDVLPRTGFVGDGAERIEEIGETTHTQQLSRIEVADWNGDGLPDILVGGERGGIIWYPNRGSQTEAKFSYAKLLFTADGKPLDVGFSATPLVIDWDGDGVQDLLSGAEWNRVVWYKNVGTNQAPKLVYKGLIYTDDGKPFELPHDPVPEIKSVYEKDYHPVLAAADINGDGHVDILAGGYITGRIYFFENLGRNKNNLPILHFRGPLEADGAPLDVAWSAAPTIADFDGDGLLDIVTGDMPMTEGGGDSASSENFLFYFKNTGTPSQPKFTKLPFPVKGRFPVGALAAPRAIDLNHDGLLDLVVGSIRDLYIFMNVGDKDHPLWEYQPPLKGRWNSVPLLGWGTQAMDWDHDGHFDLVDGFTVRLNLGKGNPQMFAPAQSILGTGEKIFHKSPFGDQWTFTQVVDMDGDGKPDILYGVHEGHVYLHRNLSGTEGTRFDTQGFLLKTEDGKPIKVGPQEGQKWDFDVLQGARTTLTAADFDRDGKVDLIVGDTYGKVRYYSNLTGGATPIFAAPEIIGEAGTRFVPSTADWNGDGWPDVIIGSSKPHLILNAGKSSGPRFLPMQTLDLPYLPYEAPIMAVDWNEDGDMDLMARASYGFSCWFERSFLEHGYARAKILQKEDHRMK